MNTRIPLVAGVLLALLPIHPSQAAAPKRTPAQASTRDAHVMKLVSDGKVLFLDADERIRAGVPARAAVVLDVDGVDPMVRAAIVREFVLSGRADVVERDALGREEAVVVPGAPPPPAKGAPPAPSPATTVRTFDLAAEHLQVEAPSDPVRWQAPDRLVQWTEFKAPHAPTLPLWLPAGAELPTRPVCAELRVIDAGTGLVRWSTARCGGSTSAEVADMQQKMLDGAKGRGAACGRGERVLQLPAVQYQGDTRRDIDPTDAEYGQLNDALAAAGCQVLDVPPGAATGGGPDAWSYHARRFDLVGTTRITGWTSARYAVQVSATSAVTDAAALRKRLGDMDEQLVDPDLVLLGDDAEVAMLRFEIKAVDLATGRIVSSARVDTGAAMPGDVIASAIADLVLTRAPSAWLEVHPLPATAVVRVDRAAVSTVEGVALLRVEPGRHGAELLLTPPAVEATASFTSRALEYGVLAMAAPYGALEVRTTPEGADVLVDGHPWGKSTVTRTTGGGAHTVLARQEGCGQIEAAVDVLIGETNRALLHLPGTLDVDVTPAAATILLNGQNMGTGHVTVSDVPYGDNTITYRLAGYPDETRKVAIDSCKPSTARFTFDGTIAVASKPTRAELRIDGERQGRTPADVIIGAGTYDVSCHWCEYGAVSESVDVKPGAVTTVAPILDPRRVSVAVGAHAGGAVVGPAFGGAVGLGAELWVNGRMGLVAGGELIGGGFTHAYIGPAFRALAPAPGWSMPLSLRVDVLAGGTAGDTLLAGPGASVNLHACTGRSGAWTLSLGAAYIPGLGALATLDAGFALRAGKPWKNKKKAEE